MKIENSPINIITRAIRSGIEKTDKLFFKKTVEQKKQVAVDELGHVDKDQAEAYQQSDKIEKNYDKDIIK